MLRKSVRHGSQVSAKGIPGKAASGILGSMFSLSSVHQGVLLRRYAPEI